MRELRRCERLSIVYGTRAEKFVADTKLLSLSDFPNAA